MIIFTFTFLIFLKLIHFNSQAEDLQTKACEKFESMSARGKEELMSFRKRRVVAFRKSLIELAELEVKHAKTQYDFLRQSLEDNLMKLL